MIRNEQHLEVTRRQLTLIEEALEALRRDVQPKNERNFAVLSEGYVEMIDKLRAEIDEYLGQLQSANGRNAIIPAEPSIPPTVPSAQITTHLTDPSASSR
jgi:uncharacterized membrane protein YccC